MAFRKLTQEQQDPEPSVPNHALVLVSLAVIFLFGYTIGWPLLEGFPRGGDTPYHLTNILYIERYFPHVPLWFYLHGCGYPFLATYSSAGYYLVFFVAKVFGLHVFESYKIVGFASILLSASAMYLFVRTIFRNEFFALMSSVFFLIMPTAWGMIAELGIFSQIIALSPLLFSFIFLELYERNRTKYYFLLAGLSYGVSILVHIYAGFMGGLLLLLYLLVKRFSGRCPLKVAMIDLIKVSLVGIGLSAFWLTAFLTVVFSSPDPSREFVGQNPWNVVALPISDLLGTAHISGPINALALLGLTFSLKRDRFVLGLGIVSGIFVFLSVAPSINPVLGYVLFPMYAFTGAARYITMAMILLPILAGFGVVNIQRTLNALMKNKGRTGKVLVFLRRPHVGKVVSLLIAILLVLSSFIIFEPISPNVLNSRVRWGSHGGDYEVVRDVLRHVDWHSSTRIDVSPQLGGIMESVNLLSDASITTAYFSAGSLIHAMWGWQQTVMYGPRYGEIEVATIAKWFGIQYVVLSDKDPLWKYPNDYFMSIYHKNGIRVLKFLDATDLIELKSVPAILVIGNEERGAFETIFQITVLAGYGPERAYTIHGSSRVDDYSLDQLRTFDAILLHGYDYNDQGQAWALLKDYVANGGSLFIETGWQYVSRDWNSTMIPEPSPVSATFWTNYGKQWRFTYISSPITEGVNFANFSPPVWNESPWGFSATNNESVRAWAEPILWNNGHPLLVTGNYGKGKVVWSGMNLLGHIATYRNKEEYSFLSKILDWTKSKGVTDRARGYIVSRPSPDKVVINISEGTGETAVIFREAYFSNWHAYVLEPDGICSDLQIYKVGPGFMYTKAPITGKSYRIVFEYRRSTLEWIGIAFSTILSFGLAIYVLTRNLFLTRWIRQFINGVRKKVEDMWYKE